MMRNRLTHIFIKLVSFTMAFVVLLPAFFVDSVYAVDNATDPVIVVSMGDSYSSGEGIEDFYGQNESTESKVKNKDWLAHRSEKSWPGQLVVGNSGQMKNYFVRTMGSSYEWYFVASSGAETKDFAGSQTKDIRQKNINSGKKYQETMDPQLNVFNEITGTVDYVTLTIGGNDAKFSEIVTTCATKNYYLHIGKGLQSQLDELWGRVNNIIGDIKAVYNKIATVAPDAVILVAGYPKLLDKEGKGIVISKDEATAVNEKVSDFNKKIEECVLECQSEGMNIRFVDVESEFDGHEAYSEDQWINKIKFPPQSQELDYKQIGSAYSMHPNEKGAKAYARCVNAEIEKCENEKKFGTLSGKIVNASDRTTPVTTADVTISATTKTISLQSDSNGNYTSKVPIGTHHVRVSAEGYIDFNAYTDVVENQTTYMETFLMVQGEEGQVGEATGTITNALTGTGLEGVTLDVRSGWNNSSNGDILTTVTTNSLGNYIIDLPIGNYTLNASKDGFVSTTINIVVQPNVCTSKDGSMTPVLSGDNYRIVLTWGENPRDLDSHVVGTLTSGSSFHVYYSNKSEYDGEIEVCNLDVDDTTSYGPETITLNAINDTPYYYYIYRYAGSGTVASSGAQVNVYQSENLIATFNVPTDLGDGDCWNVFAIVNGELVVRNTMTSNAETSYANVSAIATYSLMPSNAGEHPVYDDRYPAKDAGDTEDSLPVEETHAGATEFDEKAVTETNPPVVDVTEPLPDTTEETEPEITEVGYAENASKNLDEVS